VASGQKNGLLAGRDSDDIQELPSVYSKVLTFAFSFLIPINSHKEAQDAKDYTYIDMPMLHHTDKILIKF